MESEGGTYTRFIQLMKQHGYNKDVDFLLGTIASSPPNLRVKLDGMSIELEKDDVIVAEHLTKHKRKIRITSSTVSLSKKKDEGATSEELSGAYKHAHDVSITNGNFSATEAEIEYLDELKAGERVLVAEIENGQQYVILDRIGR